MFVKVSRSKRNNKVHETLQIAESYRDSNGKVRHRILLHLGPTDKFIKKDVDTLINGLLRAKGLTLQDLDSNIDNVKAFGQIWALVHLWKELKMSQIIARQKEKSGIKFDLEAHLKSLIFNRLDDPSSKLKLLTWLETVYIPGINKDDIRYEYLLRAMDFLIAHKEKIETQLANRLLDLFNQDLKVCFYDLTSSYFEAENSLVEGDIRQFGYSRDHRGDREQIVIGVVMTGDGIPIAHYVFPGNKADRSTLQEMLNDIRRRFKVKDIQLVADKGLLSNDNLWHLIQQGYEFILGESVRQSKDAKSVIKEANAHKEATGETIYERLTEREIKSKDGKKEKIKLRYVASYNAATALKRYKNRINRINEFLELSEEIKKKGINTEDKYHQIKSVLSRKRLSRFFNVELTEDTIEIHKQDEVLSEEEKSDGWFIVISNAHDLSKSELIARYKDLKYVEHGFYELKHSLNLRPNFHWTEKRIRAHVMVCFLAFQMAVLFEKRLSGIKLSWQRAMESLRRVVVVEWENEGRRRKGLSRVHVEQLEIFQEIGSSKPTLLSL
ncbi:transposase IS4 family protein [Caldithrix abyssi DSM 13497]|uniref:Transposase IS4 family protein n=1 Tax=Caldithrix abyssi DSM 13497 TaxID=880073 RepID=H1XPY8_CALAY|nr:IS1634 family transposase [Caldithrix abyssi]EHO41114.1 transposase IS4 family protein [Caldithrix abyssi DSM 13497]